MTRWTFSLRTWLLVLPALHCLLSVTAVGIGDPCQLASRCSECLLQGPRCSWCFKANVIPSLRCGTVSSHHARGCQGFILDPTASIEYIQNEEVRNANLEFSTDAVQISPQKIKLKLPPGRKTSFNLTFRIAEDYPVDLYYIMDLSFSMKDDQQKLINLGGLIADELKKITSDVRLGFGAFVDKAAMPFAGMRPMSITNPCFPKDNCEPMYGFKNQLSLTSDISVFGDRVRQTPISGNQDSPEGGFDALVQAMACEPEIGWRNNSRKLILFSTDARSHIAADGKLAGILEPNDGHCHLSSNEYTYSTLQDYPSISQIAHLARKTSTTIIFAVNTYTEEYNLISELIPSAVVGELANDSRNIVTLVREKYDGLIKKVNLTTSGLSDNSGIQLSMKSSCGSSGPAVTTNVCESVGIAQTIKFEVEVSHVTCERSRTKRFSIKPHDLSDSIDIELQADCDCNCPDTEFNSTKCSQLGTFTCGGCECDPGHSGTRCECDSSTHQNLSACANPSTKHTCSKHGECGSCGSCQCNCLPGYSGVDCPKYEGDFCECNPMACDLYNGAICGGNGECVCEDMGETHYCRCHPGFMGNACECPRSLNTCMPSNGTGEVCNGRGECTCGRCTCTDDCYTGSTCEILAPECSRTCFSFRDCVQCSIAGGSCLDVCQDVIIELVSSLDVHSACSYTALDECQHFYSFQYEHKNKSWKVKLLKTPSCQKDYWMELIIGLVVGVLLLGLMALIIWKVAVTIYDRREFAKFEKETSKAKWETVNNPIYKPATSTFQNPMYNSVPT